MRAIEISRSALDVEWQRLQVIAENLANANSSAGEAGAVYRPMRLLSGPQSGFATMMRQSGPGAPVGVAVLGIEPTAGGLRRVHEPDHPQAGADGFVTYTDIDQAAEMALMIKTSRVYEANLAAVSIAHQMYSRALELGRRA